MMDIDNMKSIYLLDDLSYKIRKALRNGGFQNIKQLKDSSAEQLQEWCPELSTDEVQQVIESAKKRRDIMSKAKNILNVLSEQEFRGNLNQKINTSVLMLDESLGGGIPIGFLTEVYGEAGAGKTQLCFQLCVNVQKPTNLLGVDGDAIFLDGEGTFRINRIEQIADYVSALWFGEGNVSPDRFLDRITVKRLYNEDHVYDTVIKDLEDLLKQNSKIRLIVLDGVAYHVRYQSTDDYSERTDQVRQMIHHLQYLAYTYQVAVVITNQVTIDVTDDNDDDDDDSVKPALGKIWAHTCSTKLFIERIYDTTLRQITSVKSRILPPVTCKFDLRTEGIIPVSDQD